MSEAKVLKKKFCSISAVLEETNNIEQFPKALQTYEHFV